jgi:hypothetical protein
MHWHDYLRLRVEYMAAKKTLNFAESYRLEQLIPPNWPERITICACTEHLWLFGLLKTSTPLITTRQVADRSFSIMINALWWTSLEEHVRNLLWWHELARIQQHSVENGRRALLLGSGVLGLTVLPLMAHDVVLLSIGLTVAGLASFRYYQGQCGELYLRSLTRADGGAIALATQFGYTPTLAYQSLHSALKILTVQITMGKLARVYRTRLEVLEIGGRENLYSDQSWEAMRLIRT